MTEYSPPQVKQHMLSLEYQLAKSIIPSLLIADTTTSLMAEEGHPKISPRRVAAIACDIAAAFVAECTSRKWMWEVEVDVPATTKAGERA